MPPRDFRRKLTTDEILRKYDARLKNQVQGFNFEKNRYSKEYTKFLSEKSFELSNYERWCKTLGNIIKLKVSEKDSVRIKRDLDIAHVDVEPWQALGLSIISFLGIFLAGLFISVAVALVKGNINAFPLGLFLLTILVSVFVFYYTNGIPGRLANRWRLKASSQMVPAILYVVVYMRHTSNLEKAIAFASENLQYPLSLDFKKIFYDVELGKFSTIKESLDYYLNGWKDYSSEFIEAFHLIESSLYEPDRGRRITVLEKSLQIVLDGVYEKMLVFTHDVKAPLTNSYMLTVMLPILGIALIPLASAMLGGMIKTSHVIILYNLLIPFIAFFLMDKIMLMRPGGYGDSSLLEKNPYYHEYKNKGHYVNAFLICLPLFIIGFLPLLFQYTPLPEMIGLQSDYSFSEIGLGFFGDAKIFDFKTAGTGSSATVTGPFGPFAVLLGLFIPLGIALFFSIAYRDRSKNLIKERERTKKLEREFTSSLFQLGNRIGNGVPPELVFGRVAESSRGSVAGDFFSKVNYNIRQMGMSVESAIFDSRRGAIMYYPSDLIATSMKILTESSKKGLDISAVSLMSISEYVKNINKITERLKDLLAEVVSDMKSNMTFLAPLLSGIVVGLAMMITSILNKLDLSSLAEGASVSGWENALEIFELTKIIPPYYLAIAIGIYLIQIIFVLTRTLVTIDSGEDKLETINKTGLNLKKGIGLFFVVSILTTIALFILSSVVLGNSLG
jgi:Flp pilus assembly protein TadB